MEVGVEVVIEVGVEVGVEIGTQLRVDKGWGRERRRPRRLRYCNLFVLVV